MSYYELPYEVRVLIEALEAYMEQDECVCQWQPCPDGCERCLWCLAASALARNGIEAARTHVQ